MCGIAGYLAVENADQSQLKLAAAILGIEMQSRGGQSWGTVDDDLQIVKGLGPISGGITLPLVMPPVYVLHTRFGTHGGNTIENAHPFTQGRVVGVHNGVIGNHFELNRKYHRGFAVDSQHIFQHINEGLMDLSDLEGYGAIVYNFEGSWFAGTFNRGQLEIANTPVGKIFASTSKAVESACRFAGIEILSWDLIPDNSIYELQPTEAFKRFDLRPGTTRAKWEDGDLESWWSDLSKKNVESSVVKDSSLPNEKLIRRIFERSMGPRLLLAPPVSEQEKGIVVEDHDSGDVVVEEVIEHDESTPELECAHCYSPCSLALHYVNVDTQIVCPDCARTSYCFLAPDEYYTNRNGGRFHVTCGLCSTTEMEPIVNLVNEDMMICVDCFANHYNTKGLTKVTNVPSLVH